MEKPLPRQPKKSTPATKPSAPAADEDEDDEEEEEEDEEDIPISDLEDLDDEDKEDLIPHTRLTINNSAALLSTLARIALPTDKAVPFATHQSLSSGAETAASIPDVSDDLQRELAFYSQGLEAVRLARTKLKAEGVPFSRPKDYFAEMIKEDAHMEKVRAKLVEEASNKKAAAEARKLRDLKKFGKQVQVAKLQERQKAKRETLEKIKTLKRSTSTAPPSPPFHIIFCILTTFTERQESGNDMDTHEADLFDVGVDKELSKPSRGDGRAGAGRGAIKGKGGAGNHKRQKKDDKFGFGGKKKNSKSGDAMSSADLSGFNAKKMKAGGRVSKTTRPGKARRKAMSGR